MCPSLWWRAVVCSLFIVAGGQSRPTPMTPVVLRDEYRVSHPRGGGDRCPESGSEHFSLRLVWS
jgi:hypothetical protein